MNNILNLTEAEKNQIRFMHGMQIINEQDTTDDVPEVDADAELKAKIEELEKAIEAERTFKDTIIDGTKWGENTGDDYFDGKWSNQEEYDRQFEAWWASHNKINKMTKRLQKLKKELLPTPPPVTAATQTTATTQTFEIEAEEEEEPKMTFDEWYRLYGRKWDDNLRDWENPFNLIDWIKEFLPSDDAMQVFAEKFNNQYFKGGDMSTKEAKNIYMRIGRNKLFQKAIVREFPNLKTFNAHNLWVWPSGVERYLKREEGMEKLDETIRELLKPIDKTAWESVNVDENTYKKMIKRIRNKIFSYYFQTNKFLNSTTSVGIGRLLSIIRDYGKRLTHSDKRPKAGYEILPIKKGGSPNTTALPIFQNVPISKYYSDLLPSLSEKSADVTKKADKMIRKRIRQIVQDTIEETLAAANETEVVVDDDAQ